jgi:hypothetical protein
MCAVAVSNSLPPGGRRAADPLEPDFIRLVRTSLGIVALIHFSGHLKIENYPELLFHVADMSAA